MSDTRKFHNVGERAKLAHKERRYDVAAELYAAHLELAPDDVSARTARVFALLNADRSTEALAEAREAYARKANSDAGAVALLEALNNNGGFEGELASRAEEISKKQPWLASAWYYRGATALSNRNYEAAEVYLRKAIRRREGYCLAWLALGDCLAKLEEHGRALYAYGRALRVADDFPDPKRTRFAALRGRGGACLFLGRHDLALQYAERMEPMNVDAAEAQGLKARSMFGLRHPGAPAAAENARRLGYRDAYLELRLAGAYAFEGRLEEAIRLLEEADPDPGDAATLHERASVLIRLGEADEAIKQLRDLEGKLEPYMLRNSLASAHRVAGEPRAALENLSRALEIRRDEIILTNAGALCGELRELERAERFFGEALEIKPGFPDALYQLGFCYAENGKVARAMQTLREVIASPVATEVLKAGAIDLLGRLERGQEIEAENRRLGRVTVSYEDKERERNLLVRFKSMRFEDECCRMARQKPLRWSTAEPRKKLNHAGERKEIDAYGTRRAGDREGVCIGECKLRLEESTPIDHTEMNELVRKMQLADEIEEAGASRGVEGYFFANAGYDDDAKRLAKEYGIVIFEARLGKDWRNRADWKVNELRERTL